MQNFNKSQFWFLLSIAAKITQFNILIWKFASWYDVTVFQDSNNLQSELLLKVAPYNFHSNRKIHSLGHISDK